MGSVLCPIPGLVGAGDVTWYPGRDGGAVLRTLDTMRTTSNDKRGASGFVLMHAQSHASAPIKGSQLGKKLPLESFDPLACHFRVPVEDLQVDSVEVAALTSLPGRVDPPAVKLADDVSLVGRHGAVAKIPCMLGSHAYEELVGGRCTRSMDPVDLVDRLPINRDEQGFLGQPYCWSPDKEFFAEGPLLQRCRPVGRVPLAQR